MLAFTFDDLITLFKSVVFLEVSTGRFNIVKQAGFLQYKDLFPLNVLHFGQILTPLYERRTLFEDCIENYLKRSNEIILKAFNYENK